MLEVVDGEASVGRYEVEVEEQEAADRRHQAGAEPAHDGGYDDHKQEPEALAERGGLLPDGQQADGKQEASSYRQDVAQARFRSPGDQA